MSAANAIQLFQWIAYDGTNGTAVAEAMGLPIVSDNGSTLVVEFNGDHFALSGGDVAVWRTDGSSIAGVMAMPASQADELFPVLSNTALDA